MKQTYNTPELYDDFYPPYSQTRSHICFLTCESLEEGKHFQIKQGVIQLLQALASVWFLYCMIMIPTIFLQLHYQTTPQSSW